MSSAAGSDNIVPEQLRDEPNQAKDPHQVMTAAELEDDEFLASNLALAWTDLEDIGEREADAFESGSVCPQNLIWGPREKLGTGIELTETPPASRRWSVRAARARCSSTAGRPDGCRRAVQGSAASSGTRAGLGLTPAGQRVTPSQNTATRARGNATSGRPGTSVTWIRYRSPSAQSAWRSANSASLSVARLACFARELAGEEGRNPSKLGTPRRYLDGSTLDHIVNERCVECRRSLDGLVGDAPGNYRSRYSTLFFSAQYFFIRSRAAAFSSAVKARRPLRVAFRFATFFAFGPRRGRGASSPALSTVSIAAI